MAAIDTLAPDARRTLLEVLCGVVSSDGAVSEPEREAFRGACVALGLADVCLSEHGLERIDLSRLGRRDAMLTYAAAAWMVLADGVRTRSESRALSRLRALLRMDGQTARLLAAHARFVRASTDLPWHREVDLLLTSTARRLGQLEARSRAA